MVIDELEQLKKEYAAELPQKLTHIHQAVDQVIQSLTHRRKVSWEALEGATHKLAGSSGTYGFKALSVIARYLEDLITENLIQSLGPQQAIAHLSRWYDTLSHEAHLAQAGSKSSKSSNSENKLASLKEHWASLETETTRRAA